MLKIAIPNKGSLAEGAMKLIREAGYKCKKSGKELVCSDPTNNVEFVFLRPKDIATYVASGVFSFGITGRDITADSENDVVEMMALGFGKASFRYIIPGNEHFEGFQQFEGKRIACSYPHLVKTHLASEGVNAEIVPLSGAVEISIHLGIADAAADVVETGTTIKQAGLKTVGDTIMKSEAVLISKCATVVEREEAALFLRRLEGIIIARQYVMVEYDIPVAKLDKACELSPGLESPTIAPLHDPEWRSVKVMTKSSGINDVMDELSDLGAGAIIVSAIKTCRI